MTLKAFADLHDKKWRSIFDAKEKSRVDKQNIISAVFKDDEPRLGNDIDLIVFGSVARDECTAKSDVDWTLLIDSQSNPNHDDIGRLIKTRLSQAKLIDPSPSGLFGQVTFSHDLIHYIGGKDDTNFNLSRRVLLLLESEKIFLGSSDDIQGTAYNRVVLGILERYISNDSGLYPDHKKDDIVPRYLLNDIVRYWRTMCVDFAHKQRQSPEEKWALRNIKLRMSRKFIFVKGLLMCASLYKHSTVSLYEMKKLLNDIVSVNALDFITNELYQHKINAKWIIQLLDTYNGFLGMLNDENLRERINSLSAKTAYKDDKFLEARENAHLFQEALNEIFFKEDTLLKEFTIKYGVF